MPRSRRCEKNRDSSAQIVHSPTSWTVCTPAALELVARDRLQVEVPAAAHALADARRTPRGPRRRPRSSTARARPDRRLERPVGAQVADARTPSATIPAARPRQPACSIATAPASSRRPAPAAPAAIAIGRQSAVMTIGATPLRRVACASASTSLMSSAGSGATPTSAVERDRAHGRPVHLADVGDPDAELLLEPRAVLADRLGAVVGQPPEIEARVTGPPRTRRAGS